MSLRFKVSKGLDVGLGDPPAGPPLETKEAAAAGLVGRDFPGVKFEVQTEPGARVRAGEVLARDRHRPEIAFTSPASGTVISVNFGRRRALRSIEIRIGQAADHGVAFESVRASHLHRVGDGDR